ncbi:MAG: 30S ribosomal protein S15 [Candidatus Diapherotrites archaeon]
MAAKKKQKAAKGIEWTGLSEKEIVEAIVQLANQGKQSAEIGEILRDQYGIPDVKKAMGKRISQVLAEKKLLPEMPEDLTNLIRKSVELQKHLEVNKKDTTALHGYQLTVSKIRRLAAYYIRNGRLPEDWRYTPEQAKLLVK